MKSLRDLKDAIKGMETLADLYGIDQSPEILGTVSFILNASILACGEDFLDKTVKKILDMFELPKTAIAVKNLRTFLLEHAGRLAENRSK